MLRFMYCLFLKWSDGSHTSNEVIGNCIFVWQTFVWIKNYLHHGHPNITAPAAMLGLQKVVVWLCPGSESGPAFLRPSVSLETRYDQDFYYHLYRRSKVPRLKWVIFILANLTSACQIPIQFIWAWGLLLSSRHTSIFLFMQLKFCDVFVFLKANILREWLLRYYINLLLCCH